MAQRTDLAEVMPGGKLRLHLHAGQRRAWASTRRFVCVLAGTQGGKALALDTLLPTVDGFKLMMHVRPGDTLFGQHGEPVLVIAESPIYSDHECYRVRFDDGSELIADAEHQWLTQTGQERKNFARRPVAEWGPKARTTREIAQTMRDYRGATNHAVPLGEALQFPARELPIPPYTLGAWLGDGFSSSASLVCADTEILDAIRAEGVTVGAGKDGNSGKALVYRLGASATRGGNNRGNDSLQATLRREGLLNNKHIPDLYLVASVEQREALLAGLLDTDGSCAPDGQVEFCAKVEGFARSVWELVRGLGFKAYLRQHKAGHWRVVFTPDRAVFRVTRKLLRQTYKRRPDTKRLFIVAVEPVPSTPVKCLAVAGPERLYRAGVTAVVTHNTSFGPHWLYREICRRGPGDYMVVTPSFPLLELKALPEFRKLFEQQLQLGRYVASPVRKFTFSQGGGFRTFGKGYSATTDPVHVYFGHAADPESLESATAKAAWLDEAGQKNFKLASWQAILRRLSLAEGRALITTTPYSLGWLKSEMWDAWRKGDPLIEVVRFESIANPAFPRAEYERAKANLPAWKFDLFYRALFTRPAGLIYDSFDEATQIVPRFTIPVSWPRFLGLDFGAVNTAGMFYAQEPATGRLYAYREYLAGGRTAEEHARALLAGEAMMPQCVGGSKSEGQWRREFQKGGLPVRSPQISEVELGIDRVYGWHKRDMLRVFDDLAGYIEQKRTYSRVLDASDQPTEQIEDKETYHLLDAERYILGWLADKATVQAGSLDALAGYAGVMVGQGGPVGQFGGVV